MSHKSLVLHSHQTTLAFGERLGKILPKKSILLLKGDLGAGKTTFVQGIGKGLRIDDPIVSPTFILVNEYYQGHLPLYHLDLYRTEKNMVEDLFLEQYWEKEDILPGITVIEWPERLSLPMPDAWRGKLEYSSENKARFFQLVPPLDKDNNLLISSK